MQGARLNFIENRVAPLCARLEAAENTTAIPALSGSTLNQSVTGWFDLDSLPILQQARRERLLAAKTGFDMGIPFNELNRVLDLGFKPQPWGDNGFLPANYHLLRPESSANGRNIQLSIPDTTSDTNSPASSSQPVTLYAPPPPQPPVPQPLVDSSLAALRELHNIMTK
jgi:hypothetical protein